MLPHSFFLDTLLQQYNNRVIRLDSLSQKHNSTSVWLLIIKYYDKSLIILQFPDNVQMKHEYWVN